MEKNNFYNAPQAICLTYASNQEGILCYSGSLNDVVYNDSEIIL